MSNRHSPLLANLFSTQDALPTAQFPRPEEGTGTGCSVCKAEALYDRRTGIVDLAFQKAPVPAGLTLMVVTSAARYEPGPAALADLAASGQGTWVLPEGDRPASIVLDFGYARGNGMVSGRRTITALTEHVDDAAE